MTDLTITALDRRMPSPVRQLRRLVVFSIFPGYCDGRWTSGDLLRRFNHASFPSWLLSWTLTISGQAPSVVYPSPQLRVDDFSLLSFVMTQVFD